MALEEEPSGAVHQMRSALACLRDCADLAGVDDATFERLAAVAVQFSLPAGVALFEAAAQVEAVYLLVSGRLGVRLPGSDAWVAQIERGELVGATGWLLHEPRGAAVVALRDSELISISNAGMQYATRDSALLALALARLSARRCNGTTGPASRWTRGRLRSRAEQRGGRCRRARHRAGGRIVAGRQRRAGLGRACPVALAGVVQPHGRTQRYVIYVADPAETAWTRQCCRQADGILLAARAGAMPVPSPRLRRQQPGE